MKNTRGGIDIKIVPDHNMNTENTFCFTGLNFGLLFLLVFLQMHTRKETSYFQDPS